MRMIGFAVFDRAAQGFSAPFFQQTRGLGERSFAEACTDEGSQLSKTPADFELYEVGAFDSEEGVFIPRDKPELLTTAVQVISLRKVSND